MKYRRLELSGDKQTPRQTSAVQALRDTRSFVEHAHGRRSTAPSPSLCRDSLARRRRRAAGRDPAEQPLHSVASADSSPLSNWIWFAIGTGDILHQKKYRGITGSNYSSKSNAVTGQAIPRRNEIDEFSAARDAWQHQ